MVAASTVCGRIEPAGLGSPEDRALLEGLREESGASLMGAGTLRAADPELRTTGGRLSDHRLRAVLTLAGPLPVAGKRLFAAGPRPLVFTGTDRAPGLARELVGVAEVVGLPPGPGGLSLAAALAELGRRGAQTVLIEGGGRLNHAALLEGVVDEIRLTIAPLISGDARAAGLASGSCHLGNPFLRLALLSCRQGQYGELFLHYRVLREEALSG